jgi:prepilin-type processing-associated H-X9-DG protein
MRKAFCKPTPRTPCIGTSTGYTNRQYILTARSNHPGGVNIALADGSVRFAPDTVGQAVWEAYGTIDSGEPGEDF